MTLELTEKQPAKPARNDSTSLLTDSHANENALVGFLNLWNLRGLIKLMVEREFLSRYKGSMLGALWPVLNPLGHMALYTFLFSVVLQVKFGASLSMSNFALYLMCGFLPWTAMAEAISTSTTKILEMPNLVTRVVFPLEILPLVSTISSFVSGAIAVSLLCLFSALYQQTFHWTMFLIPLVAAPHFLFTAGLSWFLAALGVFVRDCRHIVALGLSAWMYATPIVYPADKLPENLHWLLWCNPVAGMIGDYRNLILEGILPNWTTYGVYSIISLAVCLIGFHFFFKTQKSFADIM